MKKKVNDDRRQEVEGKLIELSAMDQKELFAKYDLLGFIEECYGLLHVSSYRHALDEVEEILRCNGVEV